MEFKSISKYTVTVQIQFDETYMPCNSMKPLIGKFCENGPLADGPRPVMS